MNLPEFLISIDDEIVLTGHRIGLYHLVHYYNEGFSPEMLGCQYPSLPLALIHKVIAFYLENRQEVDAYVEKCRAEVSAASTSAAAKHLNVADLRGRLAEIDQGTTVATSH
jgi:uncharacterized protein (DUF433 family)